MRTPAHARSSAVVLAALVAVAGLTVPVAEVQAAGSTGFAYVVNNLSDTVTTISVSTGGTATIPVGSGPTAVAISPGGEEAYVANGRSNTVSVLDTGDKRQITTIAVGDRPAGVAFGADGTRAYVTNGGANTVSVVDTAQRRVIATVGVGGSPAGLAVTPDGTRVYVANNGAGTVSVLSTATNTRLGNITVGTHPIALAVTPDGSRVLVANNGSGNVSVLDVGSGARIATIPTGSGPSGIAVTPDGTRTYVSNVDSDNVTVLDTSTEKVDSTAKVATIGVGSHPLGVAVSPDGTKVYVPNNGSRKTSVINTGNNDVTTSDVDTGPAAVATGRPQELTAVVSLGDSFISGVAGRWQGNALRTSTYTDVHGTDRAVYACGNSVDASCDYDARLVYGTSYNNAAGCLRSYSAEIQSVDIPVYRKINLACSGAETKNITTDPLKGDAPQADQLAALLPHYKVKLIVLNIGGNDIGFRGIIKSCIQAFILGQAECRQTQTTTLNDGIARSRTGVAAAIDKVKAVMRAGGYTDNSYEFVVQSYPSPVPYGDQIRYAPTNLDRYQIGGCPVYDHDATWVRGTVVPAIGGMLKSTAAQKGVQYLDVDNLFDGHEVCAKRAQQASLSNWHKDPLLGHAAEWARFLDATDPFNQGDRDESVHPNYYGQHALASCLTAMYEYTGSKPNHVCLNVAGKGAEHVTVTHSD
ncbi:beta-propeller fold lactonase family protein [Umezawaea sp. Da 62-37]|uniref:beta-propeller fold lactonase family protein n=1 Tax=Umezawaea sp. Da 62-37 TaxID=3075927 RepID=UPI0028F6D05A|nr:beta-propeller fold lactonase family protein [Umezawaea sp. Da 62-37]WNV85147.1 beta-propeller fold lactonase family protein [Umezawaea sp. Da 62-37]